MTTSKDKYSDPTDRLKAAGENGYKQRNEHQVAQDSIEDTIKEVIKQKKPFMSLIPKVDDSKPTPIIKDAIDHIDKCGECKPIVARKFENIK